MNTPLEELTSIEEAVAYVNHFQQKAQRLEVALLALNDSLTVSFGGEAAPYTAFIAKALEEGRGDQQ